MKLKEGVMMKKIVMLLLLICLSGCHGTMKTRQDHEAIEKIGFNDSMSLRFETVQSSRIGYGADSVSLSQLEDYEKSCQDEYCVYGKNEGKELKLIIDTGMEMVKNDRYALVWENYYNFEETIHADWIGKWVLEFDLTLTEEKAFKNEMIYLYVRTVDKEEKIQDVVFEIKLNEIEGSLNLEINKRQADTFQDIEWGLYAEAGSASKMVVSAKDLNGNSIDPNQFYYLKVTLSYNRSTRNPEDFRVFIDIKTRFEETAQVSENGWIIDEFEQKMITDVMSDEEKETYPTGAQGSSQLVSWYVLTNNQEESMDKIIQNTDVVINFKNKETNDIKVFSYPLQEIINQTYKKSQSQE